MRRLKAARNHSAHRREKTTLPQRNIIRTPPFCYLYVRSRLSCCPSRFRENMYLFALALRPGQSLVAAYDSYCFACFREDRNNAQYHRYKVSACLLLASTTTGMYARFPFSLFSSIDTKKNRRWPHINAASCSFFLTAKRNRTQVGEVASLGEESCQRRSQKVYILIRLMLLNRSNVAGLI